MENDNIVDEQPRSRQMTEKAIAAAAQDGRLYRSTLAASESNSRTHRGEEQREPITDADPAPAGHNGQQGEREAELTQRLAIMGQNLPDERARPSIPDARPSQVRYGPLRMNYAAAADYTPPFPAGVHGRAYQRARDRRRDSFDSDGGFDPSYRPGASYISLDDAKELLSHSLQQMNLNQPKVGSIDITRGIAPKWEGREKFNHFEHKVGLYMKRHKLFHLLSEACTEAVQSLHDQQLLVITDQLPNNDQMAVMHMSHLHGVWDFLKQKYYIEHEVVKL